MSQTIYHSRILVLDILDGITICTNEITVIHGNTYKSNIPYYYAYPDVFFAEFSADHIE